MEKSMKKSSYNQLHYQKNRERILAQAKKRREQREKQKVVHLRSHCNKAKVSPGVEQISSKTKLFNLELALLVPMILAMTYFLISESVRFYAAQEEPGVNAFLKAFIGEGVILLFSFLKAETRLLKWVYRSVLISACLFSLSVVSANTVSESLKSQSERKITEISVQELEHELASKMEIRDRYIKLNRITIASHYEKDLKPVFDRLKSLRVRLKKSEISENSVMKAFVLISFRLLVLLGNILMVHRVSQNFCKG